MSETHVSSAGAVRGRSFIGVFLTLLSSLGALSACEDDSVDGPASGPDVLDSGTPPLSTDDYVSYEPLEGSFPLVASGSAAPLVVSANDYAGVVRVVDDLATDIERVAHIRPAVSNAAPVSAKLAVFIGTLGKSPLIDALVSKEIIDVKEISGKWETFMIQVVDDPAPGVDRGLIIVGSDQRGTIFGAYDVSSRIGVSPWHFWSDVPAHQKSALHVKRGRYSLGEPAVKYRGLFINDENPSTGTWAPRMFGPGLAEITRAGTGQTTAYTSGLNHKYWARVFEAALRLKANYIWPAVWGRAFADDDPKNHETAKRYGVVMGTSHEAPMMRGIEEWNRRVDPTTRANAGVDDTITHEGKDDFSSKGSGEWRYSTNPESLKAYWREGIQRMVDQDFEGIVTLGMRGPGDVRLPPDTGIPLVQSIITDQRTIISEVTKRDLASVPQVWTLYKEVQNWYDAGLRAPDDVTVVWCDDNWGNMRALPERSAEPRSGGYGIYFHFDYVGGGRNYKWVDTNLLPSVWEQLHLAHSYGVDRLWMFNVGDLKGNEVPLAFALDYAWNPKALPIEGLPEWERKWAVQQFGPHQAEEIADILHTYGTLQSDRKPELLNRKITLDPAKDPSADPSAVKYSDSDFYFLKDAEGKLLARAERPYVDHNPFSLVNYGEMQGVVRAWQNLANRAEMVGNLLPPEYQDAYYQLVLYAVKASANLYELRLAQYQNLLYAKQNRASANDMAEIAEARFDDDQALSYHYNNAVAGGKWWGWQTQPKIGYGDQDRYGGNATWQQPQLNEQALPDSIFPALERVEAPAASAMGVAIDGSDRAWPAETAPATLPTFSFYQTQPAQYVEIFNIGSESFDYTIEVEAPPGQSNGNPYAEPWIFVTPSRGTIDESTKQIRATIQVDWPHAPNGMGLIPVTFKVTGTDAAATTVTVDATVDARRVPDWMANRFIEANGVVAMEADNYSRAVASDPIGWKRLHDIGRTGAGMTPWPPTAPSQTTTGGATPRLEYDVYLFSSGDVKVSAYLSPRNSVLHNGGLRYAVSIDDGPLQTVNINAGDDLSNNGNRPWERHTSDNVNLTTTKHTVSAPGNHVVKFWMVDPTVIVQKLVVDAGGVRDSYFGPPESYRTKP